MAEGTGCAGDQPPKTEDTVSSSSSLKIKHDWYQTETHVVITILLKNAEKDSVKVECRECSLSVSAKLPNGSDYSLELDLAHSVSPSQCSHKALPSKIEVKLKKCEDIRWQALEGEACKVEAPQPIPQGNLFTYEDGDDGGGSSTRGRIYEEKAILTAGPPKYPSSALKAKDWDRVVGDIVKEEADEKPEGEAALNALFQKIYSQGSDEVKRAMNKSFQESGGTVLSTNWNEVSKDKVEIKAPDGMEWKKWDA